MHYQLPPIRSLGQLILVALVICLLRPTADARVVEHRFYSPEAQGERSVNVYLPPGYDDNPWRYPVVYGMPPGNDGWEGISSGLMSDAGRMIDTGEISPLIIVQLGAPPPLRYLIHDLMPSVEQSFRVLPVRQYRAVYGHSASGRVPFQLAMNGPGSFGIIGSFAFGFREALDSSVEEYSRIYEQYPLRIYLFADDKDDDGTASRLQELGWDHTFVAGRGHTPDAAERRAFLRFLDEQMSRVRMLQPPRLELRTDTPLVVGNAADLTLAIRPALLDGSSQIDRITADLSAIGGPVALPLARQADGSHRGTAAFTVSGPNGLKSLVLHMIQGGREQPSHFEMVESVAVQPAEDLAILDDGFAAGWQTTGLGEVTFGEAPPGYQGASAGMVEAVSQSNADWLLTLTSDAPISVVGYKALRLAFHPDEAISPGSHLAIGVQGRWFRLVEEPWATLRTSRLEGVAVDMGLQEWQVISIPLSENSARTPIESIRLTGDLEGAFFLDDMRLVADEHPPLPVVPSRMEGPHRFRELSSRNFTGIVDRSQQLDLRVGLDLPSAAAPPNLSLDLSPIGEPAIELGYEGDGRYAAHPRIMAPTGNGVYLLPVLSTQGAVAPDTVFTARLWVFPTEERHLFLDAMAPELDARQGTFGEQSTVHVFEGQTSLGIDPDAGSFALRWTPPEPVEGFGYRLHFAFHPGDVEPAETARLSVTLRGGTFRIIDLLTGPEDDPHVDLGQRQWQVVEIPLGEISEGHIPKTTLAGLISRADFAGKLNGTFFLDDIRLVPDSPPPPPQLPTAVYEDQDTTPIAFSLDQSYPNPFNPETAIQFDLPRSAVIDLAIYNMAGQRVATLTQGYRDAGTYTLNWNGQDDGGRELASGVYVYRLLVDQRVATRKLMLLR